MMLKLLKPIILKSFLFILIMTMLCGVVYPMFTTGISQLLFSNKANGSMIEINGKNMVAYFWHRNLLVMNTFGAGL